MTTSRKPPRLNPATVDESAESEITIMPDGRVCAFGITRPVAELLASLPTADERMTRLLDRIRGLHMSTSTQEERSDG